MTQKDVTFEDIERRLLKIHRTAYYSWIRQVVMLAAGCLTVLVSLRNSYYPANLPVPLLLKACWAGLGLSILLGLVALRGEAQTALDAIVNMHNIRDNCGDRRAAHMINQNLLTTSQKSRYIYAARAFYLSFALSLLCLSLFAILNL